MIKNSVISSSLAEGKMGSQEKHTWTQRVLWKFEMRTDYSQEEKTVVVIAIFKMKLQQTVEMVEEEHLQNTYGAEIIFGEDTYEENEKIQMEDL